MKTGIHPTYNQAVVTCSCGNTFTVGSVLEKIDTELCSKCHPFYTGTQKLVDTAGRVESYRAKMDRAKQMRENAKLEKQKKEDKIIDISLPISEAAVTKPATLADVAKVTGTAKAHSAKKAPAAKKKAAVTKKAPAKAKAKR